MTASEQALSSASRFKCCDCCDTAELDRCGFNGDRDRHTSPCDECDPIGFAAWDAAQTPLRRSDVPF